MIDAIVVGARCAGSGTALLLSRLGMRVLLLDRARLGSDTLSTLYIHQPGVARLARWGVLDGLGAPLIRRARYEVADVRLAGPAPAMGEVDFAVAPRRRVLDWLLAGAAAAAGADLALGCSVVGLLSDGDRVCGVRFRTPAGQVVSQRASLVVGADGMRSTVARLAGAGSYSSRPRLTCAYYTYWAGVPADFEQYQRPGSWVGAMPTHDGLTLVAAYFPQASFDAIRHDAMAAYLDAVRSTAPALAARLPRQPADRLYGTGAQLNFLRQPAGPGWALVGDAGHHKDSITARGMTDAFAQAELLASGLERLPVDAALRHFADRRDDLVADGYRATLAVGELDVRADRLRRLRQLPRPPELTERYFGVPPGILPSHALFPPELLAAATVAAATPAAATPAPRRGVAWRQPSAALQLLDL